MYAQLSRDEINAKIVAPRRTKPAAVSYSSSFGLESFISGKNQINRCIEIQQTVCYVRLQEKEGESNSFESIDAWLSMETMDMADLYIFDSGLNLTIYF